MNNNAQKSYNLEQRTTKFGEDIVVFCRTTKQDIITKPIISQLVRSGTSIGTNYREANSASSKKDFRNKIYICKKEAQETQHWLQLISKCVPERIEETRKLWQECQELVLIFGKIISSLNKKKDK